MALTYTRNGNGVDWKSGYEVEKKPVGQGEGNAWGVHDMNWNVSEWVSDWYPGSLFQDAPVVVDPKGPARGEERIVRGGFFLISRLRGKCERNNISENPGYRSNALGLRLVRVIP